MSKEVTFMLKYFYLGPKRLFFLNKLAFLPNFNIENFTELLLVFPNALFSEDPGQDSFQL